MKKRKAASRQRRPARTYAGTEQAPRSPEPKARSTAARTYELTVIDSDEAELVRMTAREIFEANCPGATPEAYEGMEEEEIRAKMLDLADRLALYEEKWHPHDVEVVADACTDFIVEMRELKRLDGAPVNRPKAQASKSRK